MLYELLDTEGIYVGTTSALNVVAAVEVAEKLGKGTGCTSYNLHLTVTYYVGSTVVTVLADGAYRYQSRLFSKKWIQEKDLETAIPQHLKKYIILD